MSALRQREPRYENRRLLDVAHDAPCFLRFAGICGSGVNPSVPCHSNLQRHGRGSSYKSHDVFAVPGCPECSAELDYGRRLSREEKELAFERALEAYTLWLWQNERVKVAQR